MLVGHHQGEELGACTDCRRLWGDFRAGRIDAGEIETINGRLAPTPGTCMVMGTASTMACIVETMGLALPLAATIPATHADRLRSAEASGKQAVGLAEQGGPTPRALMTKAAFRNALVVLQAIGGSTNGLIHLTAAAGRCGIAIDLDELDRIGREVPVLIDLKPSGKHYMEHFHWAGGVPRLLNIIAERSLMAGYVHGSRRITPSLVAEAARETLPDTGHRLRPRRIFWTSAALLLCLLIALAWWLSALPSITLPNGLGANDVAHP